MFGTVQGPIEISSLNNSNKLPDVFVSSLGFIFSPGVSVQITAVSVYQLLDPLAPSLLFLSFSLNISIIVAVSSNVLSPCSSDWQWLPTTSINKFQLYNWWSIITFTIQIWLHFIHFLGSLPSHYFSIQRRFYSDTPEGNIYLSHIYLDTCSFIHWVS